VNNSTPTNPSERSEPLAALERVRVVQFGACAPTAGWEAGFLQHRLRTRFWNAICEIERNHRDTVQAIVGPLKEAGMPSKDAYASEDVQALELARKGKRLVARQEAAQGGLFWTGYLEVERAMDTARRGLEPPRFKRFEAHEGKLNFLFTNGLASSELCGDDLRVQFEPLELPEGCSARTRKANPYHVKLRVCSQDKKPVWLEFVAYLHRPIPEGSVRDVALIWRREGAKQRYSLSVTVREGGVIHAPAPFERAAINIGWKRLTHGLRVAYWRGTDGKHGEIVLSNAWLERYHHALGIESVRAKPLNSIKEQMLAYFRTTPDVPEEMATRVTHLAQWRSAARFAVLYKFWVGQRWHGDDAGFNALEAWHKRDVHLWQYGEGTSARLMRSRREQYRTFAAKMLERYGEIVMDKLDLRIFAELEARGDDLAPIARAQRVQAAPSTLRLALQNAYGREGRVVSWVGARTSSTCHVCRAPVVLGRDLIHTCQGCQSHWDVDDNACSNLLREPEAGIKIPKASRSPRARKNLALGTAVGAD